jgi:membrane-associated phospholipid phosphatase
MLVRDVRLVCPMTYRIPKRSQSIAAHGPVMHDVTMHTAVGVMKLRYALLLLALLLLAVEPAAYAGGSHQGWKDASDAGVASLLISSLAIPASRDDWQGFREAVYSDGAAFGGALLLKSVINEERPNHQNNDSFPSGHETVAFAAATTLYRRYGWQYGVIAYPVAAITGYARVAAREHHWWDVVAGAGLGFGSGWLFTHPFNRNVRLVPWIGDRGIGMVMLAKW